MRGARAIEKQLGVNLIYLPINLDCHPITPGRPPVSLTHSDVHHSNILLQRYRSQPLINTSLNQNHNARRHEARRRSTPRNHPHRPISNRANLTSENPPPPYPLPNQQSTPMSTPPSSIPSLTTNTDSDFLGDHDDPNITSQADEAARFILDAIAATPNPIRLNPTPELESAPAPAPVVTVIPATPTSVGMTMERTADPRPNTQSRLVRPRTTLKSVKEEGELSDEELLYPPGPPFSPPTSSTSTSPVPSTSRLSSSASARSSSHPDPALDQLLNKLDVPDPNQTMTLAQFKHLLRSNHSHSSRSPFTHNLI